MGGLVSKPKVPKPEEPAPLPDDRELDAARRRKIAAQTQRSGRLSTILSDSGSSGERLGR